MDLVYIIKQGEKNEDLRYSLRSVSKFVPHDKIWIVGYKPSWVINTEYIPVAQDKGSKWKNSVNNILTACNCEEISDNFVLMNDDFFAIKPIENLEESINLSLGLLEETVINQKKKKRNSNWSKAFIYIDDLLKSLDIEEPYYNYESHTPLLINKKEYLEVMSLPKVIDFMKTNKVLHKRTLYKNIYKVDSKILPLDVKLSSIKDDTNKRINICDWLSVYDNQVGNYKFKNLNDLLHNLFPESCEYEKPKTIKSKPTYKFKWSKFRQY